MKPRSACRFRFAPLLAMALSLPGCGEHLPEGAAATVSTLDNPAPAGARLPALASRGDDVLLAWIEPEGGPALRAALRTEGAWSTPADVARGPAILVDSASPPVAAILSDGTMAIAWAESNPGGEYASDLRVAFSRDGGAHWSDPQTPHRDGTATEHGFAALLPGEDGKVDILWLDGRAFATSGYGEGGTALYHATWDGEAFGPETLVDPRVCDCCLTALSRVDGSLVAAYRDRGDDELRDISVSIGGRDGSWTQPRPVHEDGWRLKACPTNGPALAASGERALLAWFTAAGAEPRVRVALSRDGARHFDPPVLLDGGDPLGRVDAVAIDGGAFAVSWLEKAGSRGEVRVRRVLPDGALGAAAVLGMTAAGRASGTPRLAVVGERTLVAWTDTDGEGGIRTAFVVF